MKIGIIGAGTLGMTLGYRLAQAGQDVTILESAPQEGGLATWFDYETFTWDKYYHVILKQDEHLVSLIEELGLGDSLRWRETKTGFLWNGRLLSMSNNMEFLKFPVLNLFDKARLAFGILYIQRVNDAEKLERITASKWLTKIFGHRVYTRMWEPLLASKFGELREQVPATIMWATIRRYYSTRAKGDGKETIGFLSGGLKTFYSALRERIENAGGTIETGASVSRISVDSSGVSVQVGGRTRKFDRLISTIPTAALSRLAPDVELLRDSDAARPKFLGVVCLSLVLRKALTKFYVTNLIERGLPFTGIIEVTALTGPREMNGRHLVMLPRYEVTGSEWFTRPEAEIAEEFLTAMRRIFPDIDDNLVKYYVNRAPHVQALWTDRPPTHHKPVVTPDRRLWSVNAELAGRDTLNNNAIVKVAEDAADEILNAASPIAVKPERRMSTAALPVAK